MYVAVGGGGECECVCVCVCVTERECVRTYMRAVFVYACVRAC